MNEVSPALERVLDYIRQHKRVSRNQLHHCFIASKAISRRDFDYIIIELLTHGAIQKEHDDLIASDLP